MGYVEVHQDDRSDGRHALRVARLGVEGSVSAKDSEQAALAARKQIRKKRNLKPLKLSMKFHDSSMLSQDFESKCTRREEKKE